MSRSSPSARSRSAGSLPTSSSRPNVHVLVNHVASTIPGIHLNFVIDPHPRGADHVGCRDPDWAADAAPTRGLHRDRHAGVRRDHPRVRAKRRFDQSLRDAAHGGQPRHQRRRRTVFPGGWDAQRASTETVVLADLCPRAAVAVRECARPRLAAGPCLDCAARGRGRSGLDGDPLGADEALGLCYGRRIRRHRWRVPRRIHDDRSTPRRSSSDSRSSCWE